MFWRLEGRSANATREAIHATISRDDPRGGIQFAIAGQPRSHIAELAIAPLPPSDVYARGADFIATYADAPTPQCQTQLDWRLREDLLDVASLAVELILSVQTDLLDAKPTVHLLSRVGAESVQEIPLDVLAPLLPENLLAVALLAAAHPAVAFRLPVGTYVEILHPLDLRHADHSLRQEPTGGKEWTRLERTLFTRPLEKGVILRARLLAAIVPTERAQDAIAACYERLATSDPPLTA